MPIQLKEIGITVLEAGIIYTIIPLLNFVVPPFVGCVGDKIGNYKILNLISIVFLALSSFLISALPKAEQKKTIANFGFSFWAYLLLRTAFEAFSTSIRVLNKATVVVVAKESGGYGKQRVWSTIAAVIWNPLTGALMNLFSPKNGPVNYKPPFYLFIAFMVPLFIFVCLVEAKVVKRRREERRPMKHFLRSRRLWFFYLIVISIGILLSIRQPYFVIFFDDLKGPPYLLGLLKALSALINIPFVYFSNAMSTKLGHIVMFLMLFGGLFLKYLLISFIVNPFLFIPVYALIPFSENFVSCATAEAALALSPKGYLASIMGLGSNANHGVGKMLGRLLGGAIWSLGNARLMFGSFSALSLTMGLIVASLYCCCESLRKTTPISDDFPAVVDETTTLIEGNNDEIVAEQNNEPPV
ncbi:Major facilitator superfamily domain-containing protein 6-like protein [Dinothrombium tinctorium]|uniref:Major facilitator superfamily domain-containing protein 6-like protein n=1 Tax=Dinothrombium tinctorium TaxID=1965070 RepID=A0A443R8Z2_9ACAR|nr:Major facilitator superfamily domain-containing protein 6-like protein [Dinothrombium tinctorium]